MKRRSKTKNLNIFKILSLILIVFFMLSTPYVVLKLIKINKIECISQYGDCNGVLDNNLSVVGSYKDTKENIEQILKHNIKVKSYVMQYKIPSTLEIEIDLKKPKFAIKNKDSRYYLIDEDKLILEISNESNLPVLVSSDFNKNIGDEVDDIHLFALKIIEKNAWLYSVKTGVLENNELKITLKEGVIVHFPLEGDIDELIGSLRLIFSRLNDEGEGIRMEDIREIDLRFNNAVLR
ncbi:MAG TPA: hypothetical protein VI795_00625 [Patescibacteria group bacterium]|nr:hypothetical protein [Patescibacteria group bacterium]